MPSFSRLALTGLLCSMGPSRGRCMSLAVPTHVPTEGPLVSSLVGQPRHAHELTSYARQVCDLQTQPSSCVKAQEKPRPATC